MNRATLEKKIIALGINKNYYSLYGDLRPDSIVLYNNYNSWEVFYFDERGNKNDIKYFSSEEAACKYVYKILLDSHNIIKRFNLNS